MKIEIYHSTNLVASLKLTPETQAEEYQLSWVVALMRKECPACVKVEAIETGWKWPVEIYLFE